MRRNHTEYTAAGAALLPGATTQLNITQRAAVPLVLTIDALLDAAACAEVVALAQPRLKAAKLSGVGKGFTGDGRSNRVAWLPQDASPGVWATVQARAGRRHSHQSLAVI